MKVKSKETFGISGIIVATKENIYTGEKTVSTYHNLVVTAGKNMIAQRLAQVGNDGDITYLAVGTGSTTPAVGDTTLDTELDRNALATISASGNIVNITGFFGASEANGTLVELGLFGEAATGASGSGTMFNHAVINETKTSSETLTFDITITVS